MAKGHAGAGGNTEKEVPSSAPGGFLPPTGLEKEETVF